ncbi:Chromosome I, complete genome, related [Eimeria mitis]|uniref:Chromosome I, complete genome, related n=1 Tax=Eimeria mitis TaxID=44415 RepID=U6JZC9_9EIME|nr:Chromosome I, complete genome, related [Eimeria mitis]CDJ28853.1 Chromosome I, complete genome, related [Eimeria mitis]
MQQPQEGEGTSLWQCSSCSKQCEEPVETYLVNLTLTDTSGSLRASLIAERAEILMGAIKAAQLRQMQLQQTLDPQGRSFNDVFTDASLTEWFLKLRAASETYMDESRIKFRVIAAEPLQQRLKEATAESLQLVERLLQTLLLLHQQHVQPQHHLQKQHQQQQQQQDVQRLL